MQFLKILSEPVTKALITCLRFDAMAIDGIRKGEISLLFKDIAEQALVTEKILSESLHAVAEAESVVVERLTRAGLVLKAKIFLVEDASSAS